MSKVKIQGHASGTGVLTIEAPNTNDDSTITLPDGDVTLGVGIDDNANATAMTIDSTEQISIGAASGGARLLVAATGNETGFQVESSVAAETTAVLKGGGTGAVSVLECRDSSNSAVLKVYQDGRGLSQFTAKAWCNFNGTGTIAFRDSHNCSSLTDNGTGEYRVNLTNAMANTSYAILQGQENRNHMKTEPISTTQFLCDTLNNSHANADSDNPQCLVFGD